LLYDRKTNDERNKMFTTAPFDAITGTSLQGYVTTTRSMIESAFGEPEELGEGDKVTTEWAILFDDGTVATIYDWKRYEMGAPETNEVIEWHIGGKEKRAVDMVLTALTALS